MTPEVSFPATSPGDLGDVSDLRAFCAVVDLGSLTAAGRLLGETKGALSRRVARFERRVGVALFRRRPRAIAATERGVALRKSLAPALTLLDAALAAARGPAAGASGALRITAPPDLGAGVVGPLLAAFLERAPDVRAALVLTEKVLSFEAHDIDVAFRVARRLRDSSLVGRRVATLEGRFFASPAYLATRAPPARPRDLAAHRLLLLPGTDAGVRLVDRRRPSRVASIAARPHLVADANVLAALASAGGGLALLPTVLAADHVAGGRLVPVLERYRLRETTSLFVVHRRDGAAREPLASFRAFAASWFAGRGAP